MRDSIDFITVLYDGCYHGRTNRNLFAKVLHDSIKKYVDYDYTLHVVNNGDNESKEGGYHTLCELFKDEPNVNIIKGANQKEYPTDDKEYNKPKATTGKFKFYDGDGKLWSHNGKCRDGRPVGIGSFGQMIGMRLGIQKSSAKYVCHVESDVVFLNKWVHELLPLLEENKFVSYAWREDVKHARSTQFSILKRETYENEYLEQEGDLVPNMHYQDTDAMISKWCKDKKLPFVITQNTLNTPSMRNKHVLNVRYGEQGFLSSGLPFVYHYSRGHSKRESDYMNWVNEVEEYLNKKEKCLIYMVAIDHDKYQWKHSNFAKYSIPTWKYWCKKHGIDFKVITKHDDRFDAPIWNKELIFEKTNNEYDKIGIVDDDTMIKWDAPNIFDLYNHEFCAVRDDDNLGFVHNSLNAYKKFFPDVEVDIDNYINAGVVFFTREHKPVFDSLLKLYFDNKEEIDNWSVPNVGREQTLFNYTLESLGVKRKILPPSWNLVNMHKKGMFDHNFQSSDKTAYFFKYGYVWHFTGFPIEQREDMMRQTWEAIKGQYED